jgi:hypothetical protein
MHHSLRHLTRLALAGLALGLGTVLGGCSDSEPEPERATDTAPGPGADELAAHDGQACPGRLPQGDDPRHGFGTSDPAELAPRLPAPEQAWVCVYSPQDAGQMPDGDGTTYEWTLDRDPAPVAANLLDRLTTGLEELVPAEDERLCTMDLGRRWMLAYAHGDDLTGVVVDDYGCREVRLTDEPFETPPGEATHSGTVPGVLTGPEELLATLKQAVRR